MSAFHILNDELLEQAHMAELCARAQFYETHCRKCTGTEMQKRRRCAILRGGHRPGCKRMDEEVKKETKEYDNALLADAFSALQRYAEFRQDRS